MSIATNDNFVLLAVKFLILSRTISFISFFTSISILFDITISVSPFSRIILIEPSYLSFSAVLPSSFALCFFMPNLASTKRRLLMLPVFNPITVSVELTLSSLLSLTTLSISRTLAFPNLSHRPPCSRSTQSFKHIIAFRCRLVIFKPSMMSLSKRSLSL